MKNLHLDEPVAHPVGTKTKQLVLFIIPKYSATPFDSQQCGRDREGPGRNREGLGGTGRGEGKKGK